MEIYLFPSKPLFKINYYNYYNYYNYANLPNIIPFSQLNSCVCLLPFVETIRQKMSLKIQKLDCCCETKTKDNVFVTVIIAVLYRVMADKVTDAFYKLADPQNQIKSYVYDVVRSTMPKVRESINLFYLFYFYS